MSRAVITAGLVLGGLATTAGPAAANHIGCGSVITQNTTLDSNVGPCAADGLVITGNGITVDLGGYRVFGAAPNVNGDNAGVRLMGVTGVTVTNGTVEGFDAGVAIMGGSGNTVSRLTVENNIADFIGGNAGPCGLGDGIEVENSSNNTIDRNTVTNNGPYGGISLVGNSDSNVVSRNQVSNQQVVNPGGCFDQPRQDEGIRIEGPGADGNRIEDNTIVGSDLAGIGLHSVVCDTEAANIGNFLIRNTISLTSNTSGSPFSGGIAFLETGDPAGICPSYGNTIERNTSTNNVGSGIFLSYKTHDNVLDRNVVNQNGDSGLFLDGPAFSNVFTNVGPSLLDLVSPDQPPYTSSQFRVLSGSGSGDVTARLVPVGNIIIAPAGPVPFDTATSGCSATDFVGFPVGAIALVQRGFCGRAEKVTNAVAAGASAVVMFNEGSAGRTGVLTAGVNPTTIPVVGVSYATGVQLYNLTQAGPVTIHVITNTTNVPVQIAPGAYNNVLVKNNGRDNGVVDGFDGNLTPPCDNNKWDRNAFGTVNQPCVQAGAGNVRKPRPPQARSDEAGTGRGKSGDKK